MALNTIEAPYIVADVAFQGPGTGITGLLTSNFNYTAPFTGAVQRAVTSKMADIVSILDFGADPTGVVDSTVAIQNAINALGSKGGTLYFPPGNYIVSNQGGGYCLETQYPICLLGAGTIYTSIQPATGTASTTNIIQFYPSTAYSCELTTVSGIFFGNPNTGTILGQHCLYLSMQAAGQVLPKFTVRDCSFGTPAVGGYSIYATCNYTNVPTGGLFEALIENNQIRGGIYLLNTGDSNVIRNNGISGPNYNLYVTNAPGASRLTFDDNNCVAYLGTKIDYCSRISIQRNEFEMVVAGDVGSDNAIIDFNGGTATSYGGEIKGNLISGGGSAPSTLVTALRLKNVYGIHVEDNVFLSGNTTLTTAIQLVDGSCINCRIGSNTYDAGFTLSTAYAAGTTYPLGAYVAYGNLNWVSLQAGNIGNTPTSSPAWWTMTAGPRILDNGQGTCGVIHPITLATTTPQWVMFGASRSIPQYYKDVSGVVHLSGSISTGLATGGTTIFTLPAGFRPTDINTFSVYSTGGTVAGVGSLIVYDTTSGGGACVITTGGNTEFCFDGVSFIAAGLADGTSLE